MEQIEMSFPEYNSKKKKREHRQTSKDAYESIKESRQLMYDKIVVGLVKLGIGGNFEQIAFASKMKPSQVWKRLSEMISAGTVYNTGETKTTTSGRKALVRQLTVLKNKNNTFVSND